MAKKGQVAPAEDKSGEVHNHHLKADGLGKTYVPNFKVIREKCSCCKMCCRVLYVIFAIIVIVKSIIAIGAAVSTAVATKIYSSDLSGRLVAMIILAVTAAVTLSITLYAIVAVFKRHAKALHAASIVLLILAVIQAVIAGVSVRVTPEDEVTLGRSLADSFRMARDDHTRHFKIWTNTQHDLTCCGLYGPEDYRTPRQAPYFSPDIPISCCPSYDPERSMLLQERDRELCKVKKEFFDLGCKTPIIEVFKTTATLVLSVIIALIILEIILSLIGFILAKDKKFLVMVNPDDAGKLEAK